MGKDCGEFRTRPQEELLERLRLLLLAPDEGNHGQLVKGLERALAALPRTLGPNDPYIDVPHPDMLDHSRSKQSGEWGGRYFRELRDLGIGDLLG
jgi:hypothetical protein